MRLSQFTTGDGTKNWGIDTSTVADFDHLLAAYGDYVYCQGDSEETIQKRARVDGSLVWQKNFNIYGAATQKILVDNQGNIYTQKSGNVYKYNSDGNLVWTCDVVEEDATNLVLKDLIIDGSKILVVYDKIYVINSSGTVELVIEDAQIGSVVYGDFKINSDGDIVAPVAIGGGTYAVRKYDGSDGSTLWTSSLTIEFPGVGLCFDTSGNVWVVATSGALSSNLYKLGKNTGNTLITSVDTIAYPQAILPVSNGNIVVIGYNSGTDVLMIDIRDGNAIQLDSETHSNITEYNSAVIAV